MALAVGVLSIKYRHKTLLMYGLIAYAVAALSCTFAPTFPIMMMAFSLNGLASAMVVPIISTLIGDLFSVNERSSAIGSVNGLRAFTYLISAPIIGYIASGYGWRMAFLFFLCPISIMSLLVAAKEIPSVDYDVDEKGQYMEGFKTIFSNRSAVSCLLGSIFSQAAWLGILTYSASFFRQRFIIGVSWASLLLSSIAGCFMVSTYASGLLVNRFGRKRMTTVGVMLFSALSIVYMVMMNVWMALVIVLSITAFSAMRFTSSISLTLEQVPAYRGTMMSLNTAALGLGRVIGSAVGGFSLLYYGWESVGYSMGVLGFVAAILYVFRTIDPIREQIEP